MRLPYEVNDTTIVASNTSAGERDSYSTAQNQCISPSQGSVHLCDARSHRGRSSQQAEVSLAQDSRPPTYCIGTTSETGHVKEKSHEGVACMMLFHQVWRPKERRQQSLVQCAWLMARSQVIRGDQNISKDGTSILLLCLMKQQ